MLNIRTILFPTDASACSERAFAHAVTLAAHYLATVHVLHVLEKPEANPETVPPAATGRAEQTAGLEVVEAHVSDPAAPDESTMAYARQHDIDLIVVGTHGQYGVARLLLGGAAEQIARRARRPVLLVPCNEKETVTPGDIQAILVPVDFSVHAREALRYAKDLAAIYGGARVDLLHVLEEPGNPDQYEDNRTAFDDMQRGHEREALQHLRQLYYDSEGPSGPVRFKVVPGHVAAEILTYATQQESDMMVMASHGRASLKAFFLGSVAEKVVHRAPCPVFMVRVFGKSLIH